jgi:hypothetical protein
MGCAAIKQKLQVDSNPNQIHAKKLQEIFNNYLKNQNKDPGTYKGLEVLTPTVVNQISTYSS